jgi:primosomal protein N' (replication factor Y)
MEQVSGRAGRKDAHGQVVIQVAQTGHPVLKYVQKHSYAEFYTFELAGRKDFGYPPFTRVIHLLCKHRDKEVVTEAIYYFYNALAAEFRNHLVGPSEPVVNRVRNQYLMELVIKLPRDAKIIAKCKNRLVNLEASMHQLNKFRQVIVIFDVDAL